MQAELKPHLIEGGTFGKRELRYQVDPKTRYSHLPIDHDWDGMAAQRKAEAAEREVQREREEEAARIAKAEEARREEERKAKATEQYEREFAEWDENFRALSEK